MSYNNSRNYNTRNSGRFNKPGTFVPSSSTNHQTFEVSQPPPPPMPTLTPVARAPEPPRQENTYVDNSVNIKEEDVEMSAGPGEEANGSANGSRHPFFKSKLLGVKKISNKERRRRQNALLRRLTSPKNALMCINEMLPNEQIANQFKVEPAPLDSVYYNNGTHNFCAELTLDGVTYKGFGENKLMARNAAAEQAIRDITLRKMERYSEIMAAQAAAQAAAQDAGAPAPDGAGAETAEEEGEALPMIQLLSFALHKLFAEWEGAGHHVPQLRAHKPSHSAAEEELSAGGARPPRAPAGAPAPAPAPAAPRAKKPKKIPENASSMHPAMLLTILRPQASYRELNTEGDKPQNMIFTIAVDTDDNTFIGRAPNKKEARKQAARAACKGILGITFDDEKLGIPTLTTN